jgi:hypothetical protein
LAHGIEIGPWGLVTLALGATPTLTPELEELELELVLEDELPPPVLVDFPPDFPPPLGLELDEELRLKCRLPPGRCIAMLPSMGAKPRAIAISQRVRFIRSLRANGLRYTHRHAERHRQRAKTHDNPRRRRYGEGQDFPISEQ